MKYYYEKKVGKYNHFSKFALKRSGKKGLIYLCGDKLGIFSNAVTIGYGMLKFMGVL